MLQQAAQALNDYATLLDAGLLRPSKLILARQSIAMAAEELGAKREQYHG